VAAVNHVAGPRYALLWAVPDGWVSFELFQRDLEERIEAHIRDSWRSAGLDPDGADDVVATQVDVACRARDAGVLLLAASAHGAGTPESPLSAVNLTLALRPLEDGGGAPSTEPGSAPGPSSNWETAGAEPRPLVLQDPMLCGFVREIRTGPLLTVEALVAHRKADLLAALAVATTDSAREDEARTVAREVADTIAFLPLGAVAPSG
jgi:hypothetical protein